MEKLQFLVVHCTDTPAGREVTSDEIRHWHTDPPPQGRGWHQVGYSRMYHLDGRCEQLVDNNNDGTVDAWEITNGVEGMNAICQHIVYVGGMSADKQRAWDTRTPQQLDAMSRDITAFHHKFPDVKIVGHNYFNRFKACPSFDVQKWLSHICINQQL